MRVELNNFSDLYFKKSKKGNYIEKKAVKKFKKEVGKSVQSISRAVLSEYIVSDATMGLYVIVWFKDEKGQDQQIILDMIIPRMVYDKVK